MDRLVREQSDDVRELVALCLENEDEFWEIARNYGLWIYSDPWELAYAALDSTGEEGDVEEDDEDRQERAARECRLVYGIDPEDVDEDSVIVVEEDIGKAYIFKEDNAVADTVSLLIEVLEVDVNELMDALV